VVKQDAFGPEPARQFPYIEALVTEIYGRGKKITYYMIIEYYIINIV
jgi:hypothetical protein